MFAVKAACVIALVLAAGFTAWLVVERTNRQPHLGVLALFTWVAALVLFLDVPDLFVINLGGINVVAADVLCTFLAGIASLRFLQRREEIGRRFLLPLALVGGMLLLSYFRGVLSFGLQPATNEFREFFYFLTALAFTLSFPVDQLALRIPVLSVIGGLLLVAVTLVRIPMMGGFGLEQRPLPSYAALAMGQAFFFGWGWAVATEKSRAWQWGVLGFLLLAIMMLHRSVWIALSAGLLTLLLLQRRGRKSLMIGIAAAGAFAAVAIFAFFGEQVIAGLHEAVAEATSSETSTFMWRVEGWLALLHPDSGWDPVALLIGNPMGSGYSRSLGNSVLTANDIESGVIPHNYYLSLILRAGVIGLIAFVLLYFRLAKALLSDRRNRSPHPYSMCFLAIVVTQLIYYIPYSADITQGVFLGSCVIFASALVRTMKNHHSLHEHRYIDDLPQPARQNAALSRVTRTTAS